MIRVIIVDDHFLVREGLKKLLGHEVDIKVAAEAKNANELFNILRSGKIEYDMICLDLSMPDTSGVEIIKDLKTFDEDIKILVLTIHPPERFAVRAIKAGALGYLTKKSIGEEILPAVRTVAQGREYITPSTAAQLAATLRSPKPKNLHDELSDREFEVLRLIGMGKTVAEIADKLAISNSTVHTYKARIMEKMEIDSLAELMHYALKNELM